MDWKEIGKKVADAAPMLGTLLGGPAGGAFGALVASTLGTKPDPQAVDVALKSPDALIKLRELENAERASLRQHVLDMTRTEAADRADARAQHKSSRMPAVITLVLALMCSGAAVGLFAMPIPDGSRDIVLMFLGQLVGAFLSSVAYWVGSSRGSSEKTALLVGSK